MMEELTYQDVKLVNCATCRTELVGQTHGLMAGETVPLSTLVTDLVTIPNAVYVWLQERPYCKTCARHRGVGKGMVVRTRR